jgi:hypothetical protein
LATHIDRVEALKKHLRTNINLPNLVSYMDMAFTCVAIPLSQS